MEPYIVESLHHAAKRWFKQPPTKAELKANIEHHYESLAPAFVVAACAAHSLGEYLRGKDLWKPPLNQHKRFVQQTKTTKGQYYSRRWWQYVAWPVATDQRDALLWTTGRTTVLVHVDYPVECPAIWVGYGARWREVWHMPFDSPPSCDVQQMTIYMASQLGTWEKITPRSLRIYRLHWNKDLPAQPHYSIAPGINLSGRQIKGLTWACRYGHEPEYRVSPDRRLIASIAPIATVVCYSVLKAPKREAISINPGFDPRWPGDLLHLS